MNFMICSDSSNRRAYGEDMPFSRLLRDAACLPLFDGGNVGVRRRQIETILKESDYEPWAATFDS